ncbi:MAG: hypothetical protein FWD79_10750 [Desulfobulbus sp.]|nr:hypothetical protein [Desulfobulbus sp.]
MGHLLGYLLLILAINLLREGIKPSPCDGNTTTVRRRLWSDSKFDCYSTTFSVNMLRLDSNESCQIPGATRGKAAA